MKIYFASSIFSKSDLLYNNYIISKIKNTYNNLTIYAPQNNKNINNKNNFADSIKIAKNDTKHILNSNLLIALLDGISIDPGVASEIGIAYIKKIPIIGLYTDIRQNGTKNIKKIQILQNKIAENQFQYLNLYTVGLIKLNGFIVNNENLLIKKIKFFI